MYVGIITFLNGVMIHVTMPPCQMLDATTHPITSIQHFLIDWHKAMIIHTYILQNMSNPDHFLSAHFC
jgi:hypothetical protein